MMLLESQWSAASAPAVAAVSAHCLDRLGKQAIG